MLLLIIALGLTEIASAQLLTPDSCIYYTPEQDIRCLKCLVNEPKKDSLIYTQTEIIENLEKKTVNFKQQINLLDSAATYNSNQLNNVRLTLDRTKKRSKNKFIGGLSVGALGIVLLRLLLN